ncbi:MAG: TolC family protein [Spirochaetales bacterium]|nr:MAG: TolC family protein [Spirochaetales bacterium]
MKALFAPMISRRPGRQGYFLALILFSLLVPSSVVFGQASATEPLSLAAIAAMAVREDPAIRASAAAAGIAAAQYALELNKAHPKFALGLTPLLYDSRRFFDFNAFDYVDTAEISAGAGLSYTQSLPSAGSFAAGVKSNFGYSDTDGKLAFALSPSLNASLRQPLFAGGQFLPFGASAAVRRSAAATAEQSRIEDLARRNQAIRSAVESAGWVLVLRRTLAVQEASLDTALRRAEGLNLRRSVGTATEDAALELALTAELVRQSLVDTRLSVIDAERRLASVLGIQPTPEGTVILPPISERVPVMPPAPVPVLEATLDASRAALAAEKARADATARSTIDATIFAASLSVAPRYPDSRLDAANPANAFSDFSDGSGGAGFNWNLTLTLDVPLSGGAARGYRERADTLAIASAEAQRSQAERSVQDRAASLAGRRDALTERLAIQRRIAELDGRKAERLADLAAAGTATAADTADARAERDRALTEVLRTELDLLLAELDLRALSGEDLAASLAAAP